MFWQAGYETLKTATCASPSLNAADAVPVIRSSMHSCLKHLLAPPALPPWLHPRKTFPATQVGGAARIFRASPSLDSQPHTQPRSALHMGCSPPRHHSTSLSARGSRSSQSATPTTTTTTRHSSLDHRPTHSLTHDPPPFLFSRSKSSVTQHPRKWLAQIYRGQLP